MLINFERLKYVALGLIVLVSACDPCRDLGDNLCICLNDSEIAQRQCKERLNVAKSHKFFEIARDRKLCEKALKCRCKELLNGEDEQCGMYRPAFAE